MAIVQQLIEAKDHRSLTSCLSPRNPRSFHHAFACPFVRLNKSLDCCCRCSRSRIIVSADKSRSESLLCISVCRSLCVCVCIYISRAAAACFHSALALSLSPLLSLASRLREREQSVFLPLLPDCLPASLCPSLCVCGRHDCLQE